MLIAGMILFSCIAVAPAQEPEVSPKVVKIHPPDGTRIKAGDNITAAKLVHREQPVYPPLARQTRISGTVRLHAIIGTDGKILQLEVLSGHPLLVQSALDAVRKWEYQPTQLNGEPVEVDTTIDVIFALNENAGEKSPQPTRVGPTAQSAIDPALRADLEKLLELTSSTERSAAAARQAIESMRSAMFRNITDDVLRQKIVDSYEDKLIAIFKTEKYREVVITGYAKYFNDDDAKALIAFYQTPAGQKFNHALPQLMADMMEMGQRLAKDRIPGIFKELCEENPVLAGKLPDCQSSDDKKSRLTSPAEDRIAANK